MVAIAGYANHATTSPIRTNLRGSTVVSPPSASRARTVRHVCALGVAVLLKLEVRAQGVIGDTQFAAGLSFVVLTAFEHKPRVAAAPTQLNYAARLKPAALELDVLDARGTVESSRVGGRSRRIDAPYLVLSSTSTHRWSSVRLNFFPLRKVA